MDLYDAAIVVGILIFSFVFLRQSARALVSTVTKRAQITDLLKEFGIKNFKPEDLKADHLDEVGFGRLITLIREVKGVAIGGQAGQTSALMNQIAALAQLGSLGSLAAGGSISPSQPPAPQRQS